VPFVGPAPGAGVCVGVVGSPGWCATESVGLLAGMGAAPSSGAVGTMDGLDVWACCSLPAASSSASQLSPSNEANTAVGTATQSQYRTLIIAEY